MYWLVVVCKRISLVPFFWRSSVENHWINEPPESTIQSEGKHISVFLDEWMDVWWKRWGGGWPPPSSWLLRTSNQQGGCESPLSVVALLLLLLPVTCRTARPRQPRHKGGFCFVKKTSGCLSIIPDSCLAAGVGLLPAGRPSRSLVIHSVTVECKVGLAGGERPRPDTPAETSPTRWTGAAVRDPRVSAGHLTTRNSGCCFLLLSFWLVLGAESEEDIYRVWRTSQKYELCLKNVRRKAVTQPGNMVKARECPIG